MAVRAIIQARMSSQRFPGKVLAPFRGRPLIAWVVDAVRQVMPQERVVVAMSTDPADDPLAAYLAGLGVAVFRGPREDVFERFRQCLAAHPGTWILRVNGDSPLLSPAVLEQVLSHAASDYDLVSTIFPRTFPRGQNAELISTRALLALNPAELSVEDHEHVTPYFYRHPERFKILNVESGDAALADQRFAVDTLDDLRRLEALPEDAWASWQPLPSKNA